MFEGVGAVEPGTPAQLQPAGEMFGELMEDQNRRYLVTDFR